MVARFSRASAVQELKNRRLHFLRSLFHLAQGANVAASAQNVAFSALLFLYRDVLKSCLPETTGVERSTHSAVSMVSISTGGSSHGRRIYAVWMRLLMP